MNVFQSTKEFDDWLRGLKDRVAKARIFSRIDAATLGNFGECEAVGEGVSEMKDIKRALELARGLPKGE
uniref:hypothetical protein n=1 Tax=Orrella sp. TaxID=1921583 RepID=UPI0040557F0B